jgi:hypothetical protein
VQIGHHDNRVAERSEKHQQRGGDQESGARVAFHRRFLPLVVFFAAGRRAAGLFAAFDRAFRLGWTFSGG